jgi:predicted extracellular nuclease
MYFAIANFNPYNMRILFLFFSLVSAFYILSAGINKNNDKSISIVFYNVENLFDTIDAPNKIDDEFMPVEPKNWNTDRYNKKINDLASVIAAIDSVNLPVIFGVCEIENDVVLKDLVHTNALKRANYQIIWNDGPDERGIDCAFIYNPKIIKVLEREFIPVVNDNDSLFITREIVYVKTKIRNEEFHFFVNHWPSRRNGQEVSDNERTLAATILRKKVDSLLVANQKANIVIMGDMNDEPTDKSLFENLKALPANLPIQNNQLVNLMYEEAVQGDGSYKYKDQWDMIDNLIVSGNLINKKKGLKTTVDDGKIFHQPFMEFRNDKGEISPNRTYGRTYFGGISDHFPVYFKLAD